MRLMFIGALLFVSAAPGRVLAGNHAHSGVLCREAPDIVGLYGAPSYSDNGVFNDITNDNNSNTATDVIRVICPTTHQYNGYFISQLKANFCANNGVNTSILSSVQFFDWEGRLLYMSSTDLTGSGCGNYNYYYPAGSYAYSAVLVFELYGKNANGANKIVSYTLTD